MHAAVIGALADTAENERMAANERRRRILIVNEPLQKRIILTVSLIPTIGLSVCTLIVAVFCRRLLGEATEHDVALPSLVPLFFAILGFTVASAAVVVFQALRFSHRIAGPAYRLVKSMERIRTGDISFRVNLRRGDHLTEVATEMNNLLDWLNENPPAGVKTGTDLVRVGRKEPDAKIGAALDACGMPSRTALMAVGTDDETRS
jgi:methyl-accepting chemotaxis protein